MGSDVFASPRAPVRLRWPWALAAAAWAIALLADPLGLRVLVDHHFLLEESGLPWPVAALIFLAGWQVMIAAMMVPVSLPVVGRALAAGPGVANPHRAVGAYCARLAFVWTLFGLAAFAGDTGIHALVDAWPWLATHTFLIGATTFALAGLFQLSPWKAVCLAACRDPQVIFAVREKHASDNRFRFVGATDVSQTSSPGRLAPRKASSSFESRLESAPFTGSWLGLHSAWASVGCCWALMLVMFGVGVGGVGWMAMLTGAMLVEVVLPERRRARQAIGVALLLLAALWIAHPAGLIPPTA